ncbi:DNA topoisomerase [Glomus cerebriforme]|uniref:DNA topoisomerase (ATP-hydrolyzing) n=1 Tax=Glomus cerebriforme TaxID=658196 RepID=A0A397SMG5_9GLOM|nr:DNA topoisomerase [Glomus cerebriforme]
MTFSRPYNDTIKVDIDNGKDITGIPMLDYANNSGIRNDKDCTLILTEGDSAKSLAVAGLSFRGFPLRGRLLNVPMPRIKIQHIKQILGLKQGNEYESTGELRYGHDHDGSRSCWKYIKE